MPVENGEKITDLLKDTGTSSASRNGPAPDYTIQKPAENLTYDDYSVLQKELHRFRRQLAKWETSDISPSGIGWFKGNLMHLLAAFEERLGRK
jgi:hypothetical protein